MKLDPKGLEAAMTAISLSAVHSDPYVTAKSAITAYCKDAGVVMVDRETASSAFALLMGLSIYWDEKGDKKQSAYVADVAKRLSGEAQEEEA